MRRQAPELPPLPGIVHCRSLKMLGVVIADDFSVTQHVQQLVTSSAQTNYALRVLRCHGLGNAALQHVYRATIFARLTYAASAWRDFIKASDLQCINSVMDRARRLGYCSPDTPTFEELCDSANDDLFTKALRSLDHLLHPLLPQSSTASQHYNLKHRAHSLQLPEHVTQLSDSNFLTGMLYKNIY